jgi:hypothetical protein
LKGNFLSKKQSNFNQNNLMTKYSTTPTFFILLFFLGISLGLNAQQLSFSCPTSTVIREDLSNNDPTLWNAAYWLDPVINSNDLAEEGFIFDVLLTNSCTTGTPYYRFILDLDLDGNGQRETRIDSDSLPGRDSIHFNNIASGTVTGGEVRRFDFRPVAPAGKYRFYLANDSVGPFTRRLSVRMQGNNNAPAILPYGTHEIQWTATNGCGQTQTCSFLGQMRDGAPPKVVCLNGLSLNLANTQPPGITLYASNFLQYTEDYYTPANLIKIAIRRKGQPDGMGNTTGFPRNADGTPQTIISFNCSDIGTQEVNLWAIDKSNLTDSCTTYVLIQDNALVCTPGVFPIRGTIATEVGGGVADVEIIVNAPTNGIPSLPPIFDITDSTGTYGFPIPALPVGPNARLTPKLNIDPLNGVNTWDLILISRNILGLEPLNSPYKLIAADANKSGTVTTYDIVELRKLILGTLSKLPNNTSWRFVVKTQVFTNPAHPFADTIRESVPFTTGQHDFVGIKIGDVDYSASPNFQGGVSEVRTEKTALMETKLRSEDNNGQIWQFLPAADLAGYQMTVHLGQNTLAEIIPQGNLTNEHFAVHERNGETVLTAVSEDGAQPFAVRLRNADARFHPEGVRLSDEITPTVGYDRAGTPTELLLHLSTGENAVVLHPNTPNPWRETTAIRFELPRAGAATLRFFDATGRLVHASQTEGVKGINSYNLVENAAFLPGLYTFSLEFEGQFFVQKIVRF